MGMRPISFLAVWAVLVLFATEAFTSGGAEIEITHDDLQVFVATARKQPMRGEEADYAKRMTAWEQANRPVVDKAVLAIEKDVLARYKKKLPFLAKRFDAQHVKDLSTEGVARPGGYDDAVWRLTVDLDLFGPFVESRARFIFKSRPSKAEIRAFSRDVQAAALRTVGRKPPPAPTYTAYWLGDDSLLLATVPLAKLPETLQQAPYRTVGFEAFRRAPALVIQTAGKRHVVKSTAGFLLANPTAAKLEAGSIVLQVNGSYLPALTVRKATRAEAVKVIDHAADPLLSADDRAQLEDDLEFLSTLKPSLAN
jgi:hypothetical protein